MIISSCCSQKFLLLLNDTAMDGESFCCFDGDTRDERNDHSAADACEGDRQERVVILSVVAAGELTNRVEGRPPQRLIRHGAEQNRAHSSVEPEKSLKSKSSFENLIERHGS